jgi:hypothetical protein
MTNLSDLDMGACIDALYEARSKRLAAQKDVDALAAEEELIKNHLINNFEKAKLEGAKGRVATATLTRLTVPVVKDWGSFCEYVRAENAFDLIERRVAKVAYRDRLEENIAVPGLEPFVVVGLSLTKSSRGE